MQDEASKPVRSIDTIHSIWPDTTVRQLTPILTPFSKKLYSIITYWNINIHIDPIIYWLWKNPFKEGVITPIIEDHSSVKAKWYQYILGTKWYANKVKHKYNEYKKSNNIYLVDYV